MSPASPVRVELPDDLDAPLRTATLDAYGCQVALVRDRNGTGYLYQRPLNRDGEPDTGDWVHVIEPDSDGPEREALNAALDALGVQR